MTTLSETILIMPRFQKRIVALISDALICVLTVGAAFVLRVDYWPQPQGIQWLAYICAVLFALPLFVRFGLYRAIFRYIGWSALMGVVRACAIYGVIYCIVFTVIGLPGVPRTIGVIQPLLLFLSVSATRAVARYWLGGGYQSLLQMGQRRRVLIYGAGSAGRQLAAGLANSDEMQMLGFVDDDSAMWGSVLNGKPIFSPDNLDDLVRRLEIVDLLLALPSATRQRRAAIIDSVRGTSVTIRTLPSIMDLAHGRVTVNDLRELDIEDLLGRDTVPPDADLLAQTITGKTVLVTGAGGSIGSELCRQILALDPATLLLVDSSEFNLYTIHHELDHRIGVDESPVAIVPLLGSIQDEVRMDTIFASWQPDIVYHAAAYKHVPLVEHNLAEGVRNNVFGTWTVAKVAQRHKTGEFVLVSTDKAVRPTNFMGATKRLAEQLLQALAADGSPTRFCMVRFGNVLGSSGSVVPLFRKQIRAGGPITITHADITRYFMTIPEAAQLVIQAGAMMTGGEVFVLDMKDPVKIVDLARRMVELSGLSVREDANPDGDIIIQVVGLRPGEKLFEELLIGDNPETTAHPGIMKARDSHLPLAALNEAFAQLEAAILTGDLSSISATMSRVVPEYSPTEAISDLIYQRDQANGAGRPPTEQARMAS
jgi:FlaA1/EpsC-like NDP-sugar epimerase